MVDIKELPIEQLLRDLEEAAKDMQLCQLALDSYGADVKSVTGHSIMDRRNGNAEQIRVIGEEITRRDNHLRALMDYPR